MKFGLSDTVKKEFWFVRTGWLCGITLFVSAGLIFVGCPALFNSHTNIGVFGTFGLLGVALSFAFLAVRALARRIINKIEGDEVE